MSRLHDICKLSHHHPSDLLFHPGKDYQHACQPGAGDDAAQALLYMLAHKAVPAAPYYGFVASDHAAMWRAEAPTASLGSDHTCMAACHAECPAVLRHSDCTSICTPRCVAERGAGEARRAAGVARE